MKYFIENSFKEHYCDHDQNERGGCKLQTPNFRGYNIPWLKYKTRGEELHDGYGNGFHDYYFKTTDAEFDLKKQLDFFQQNNIKFLRLWTCFYHSMNNDKDTVGYTGFKNNFIENLQTYLGWCVERDLRVLLCIDDSWYTFQWMWLANEDKKAKYLQAYKDIITATKDLVWGYDYANEPYMGWTWSDVNSTIHKHKQDGEYADHDIGYTRVELTNFFKEIYQAGKQIFPKALFSVGHSYPAAEGSKDLLNWDLAGCSDFYQFHQYNADGSFPEKVYGKPYIIGECGGSDDVYKDPINNAPIIRNMIDNGIVAGAKIVMPWSIHHHITKDENGDYYGTLTTDELIKRK